MDVSGWKVREIITRQRKGKTGHRGSREMGFCTWTRKQDFLIGFKSKSKTVAIETVLQRKQGIQTTSVVKVQGDQATNG